MFERVRSMLVKEFLELKRDPWALFRLVVPLIIQVLIYGYAATFTVNHVPVVLLDLDRSQASRDLVSHFIATGRFQLVDEAATQQQIEHSIGTGRATLAIVVHAGFAQSLQNGQSAPLQVIVDGSNSNTALIALGYVNQVVAQFQSDWMARA
jgi:ABC-2 type transport system permease protein